MLSKGQLKKFHDKGYLKFNVLNKKFLNQLRQEFLLKFKKLRLNKKNFQKKYHKILIDLKEHHKVQSEFQKIIFKKKIHYNLIKFYKSYFAQILGQDIAATTSVNFRAVRPKKNIDNIGFHRDTDLGHTPYEINVWVPLFDTNKSNSLYILPKSHQKKLDYFKFTKMKTKFIRGGNENKLGYFYKSFKFKNLNHKKMIPIVCKFGQIIIFYSSCIHGTKTNTSNETRFSFDFNISNSFFPIKWFHHGNETKYEKILFSNISKNAKKIKI
jgi:sporadic carbohydrate cluster 2OG-Fe(II) oxygenase